MFAEFVVLTALLDLYMESLYTLFNWLLFTALTALALSSHFKSMTTDPGAVPCNNATEQKLSLLQLNPGEIVIKCAKCCSIKPGRAHHCSKCKRCIRKMDHHCPWINNCVGESNKKYFVLFVFYSAMMELYVCAIVLTAADCINESCVNLTAFKSSLLYVVLVLLGFTVIILSRQLESICSDVTTIDRLFNRRKRRFWLLAVETKWSNMKSVFGDKFSVYWFSPFSEPTIGKED